MSHSRFTQTGFWWKRQAAAAAAATERNEHMSRVKEQLSRVKRVTHDLLKRVFVWKRQAAAAAATERNEQLSRV